MGTKTRKLFLCLVFLIVFLQVVSAIDTNVQIKTVPYMNVNVLVVSSTFDEYERFNADADKYGDMSFVFSSDKTRFGLIIFVKDESDTSDNGRIASKELRNQIAGMDIYIEVVPEGFKIIETPTGEANVSNVSIENLTESSENVSSNDTDTLVTITEKSERKSFLSGLIIFGENNKLKEIIFYSAGGVLLALIIFFITRKFRKRGKRGIKIKKLSELREEQKEDTPGNYYGILEETQKKLEETQRELSRIKNKDKIKEVEEKLKKDEQELRRLRGF